MGISWLVHNEHRCMVLCMSVLDSGPLISAVSMFVDHTAAFGVDRNADYTVARAQWQLDAYIVCADKWKVAVIASKSIAVVVLLCKLRFPEPKPWNISGFTLSSPSNVFKLVVHLSAVIEWPITWSYLATSHTRQPQSLLDWEGPPTTCYRTNICTAFGVSSLKATIKSFYRNFCSQVTL